MADLTAAKSKLLTLPLNGFFLFSSTYICIYMVYDYFCLCPAQLNLVVIRVRNFESHLQFGDRCAPVEISNSAENSVLKALQFQELSVRYVLSAGTGIIKT
jgi:hypothetical protein